MLQMKIARIDVFQVDLPYIGGVYHLSAGRTYTSFDATIVRITTEDGTEGWGESTPFGSTYIASHALGVRAGIAEIAPKLIGLDPRRVDRINDAMDAALVGHEHAKTALDVACWDIFGKSTGLPVCELLGGRTDAEMPVIDSIHVGTPQDMRERVAKFRAQGYKAHSLKIEGEPIADAARIMESVADRQPGEFFLVDANGGLTVETGLRLLRLVPALDFVLEAPCKTRRECLSLRRRTNIPMIMDELATDDASVVQLIADDAIEGIGLKISKAGGLTRGRRSVQQSTHLSTFGHYAFGIALPSHVRVHANIGAVREMSVWPPGLPSAYRKQLGKALNHRALDTFVHTKKALLTIMFMARSSDIAFAAIVHLGQVSPLSFSTNACRGLQPCLNASQLD